MTDKTPTPSPTQTVYPWKATLRTAIAVIVAVAIVAPQVLAIVQDQLGGYIRPDIMTWLAWAVGLLVAISLALTRIMAIPAINGWLTSIGLGATPKS
jgi:hypothetical protein